MLPVLLQDTKDIVILLSYRLLQYSDDVHGAIGYVDVQIYVVR